MRVKLWQWIFEFVWLFGPAIFIAFAVRSEPWWGVIIMAVGAPIYAAVWASYRLWQEEQRRKDHWSRGVELLEGASKK